MVDVSQDSLAPMKGTLLTRWLRTAKWHLPFVLFLLAVPQHASAGWLCSMNHAYPEVTHLDVVDGQLVATLGDYFATKPPSEPRPIQLLLGDGDEWTRADRLMPTAFTPPHQREQCMEAPLDVKWLKYYYDDPDPANGFEQKINVCTTHGNVIWGGISFYGDESGWGIGGLVRKDLTTENVEYHRPEVLREYSVSEIQYYDDQLWIGTTFNGECSGPQNGFGLKRYDLAWSKEHNIVRDVPEICGFAVRKFAVFDGDLWVATDLGLARSTKPLEGKLKWQNYVPDLSDERKMRPVECADLYEELLRSRRIATDTAFDMGYAFEDFWGRLTDLRPGFTSQYLRRLHEHEPAVEPNY